MQVLTFVIAQGLGIAASRIGIPGAGIVIPMLGTAVFAVSVGVAPSPLWVRFAILVLMGAAIGSQIDRDSLRSLRRILAGATVAAVAIILLGVLTTLLLRAMGLAPHGDMLATSPGALSAMTAAALENDFDAPTVAVFHITRILIIVLSIPLLVRAMQRARRTDGAPGRPTAAAEAAIRGSRVPTEPIGHQTFRRDARVPLQERMRRLALFLLPTAGAAASAGIGLALGGPLPIVVNAFFGAGVVSLLIPTDTGLPKGAGLFVQSGLAWLIGSMITQETLATLGQTIIAAVLSAFVLIVGGLAIALGLRRLGLSVDGDVLATSPGALEVLTVVGAENGASVVDIGLFHLVRLLIVMLTLPALLLLTQ